VDKCAGRHNCPSPDEMSDAYGKSDGYHDNDRYTNRKTSKQQQLQFLSSLSYPRTNTNNTTNFKL